MLALFFFLFLLIVPFVNSQNVSSSDETNILLSLKQHWGNPPALDSWNSLSSACDWPDVFCSSSKITTLYLADTNINGTISSAICQLRNLVYIDLSNNWLSGRIPTCLYNFSNLEHLDLSMNHQLSGTIPGELFCMQRPKNFVSQWEHVYCGIPTPMQAYSLELVDFSNNNLNGSIPDDIRNLSGLQHLDLSMNLLSGSIPRWLFRMHRLNFISLSNNNFYGSIPHDVRNLYSLELLDLSRNSFSGSIPDDIRNLSSLQHLDLSINFLSGSIPRWLFRMHQLNYMSLANNNLTGELPDVLDLSMNHQLSGTIPGELFCMQRLKNFISQWEHVFCGTPTPMQAYSLESVNFSNNNLNGSIPDDIRNLSSLQHLDLSMNLLSGSIPRWLFHMHRLNHISLSNSNFYGSIPDDVRNLYSLELLDLSRNSFSGSIPDDIRNLSSLQHLDLSINWLSGSIPRWLFRMHQLNYMSLANNNLTGELPDVLDLSMNHQLSETIPGELFCMQRLKNFISQWEHVLCGTPTPMQAYSLESVNFSNNNLNGSIPDDIRNLSSLQHLDLSMNLLSGSIPRWLFRMHRLNYISLSNNNFYGSIPDDVRNLYSLELLDLSRNSFSGSIPDDIRNLSSLQHLDLSINWLSGSIPRWLFRMHQLNYMSLANNNLTGELPDVLDLSMNHQLSETIPGELFCMQRLKNFISQWEHVLCGTPTPMQAYSLESVNFSNNNLNGSIPDDIRNLSSLQHLDLSMNLLSGSIPRWLFHMHRLNHISLSNSNFYGSIPDDVRNLYSLELLDLSRNSFSGSIPDDIRNLSSLQHLDLSINWLSGSIPRWLFRMHQLNYMSLANNNLTGELPDVLDLSMNHQLSETIPGELFCMQRLKNFISQWEHVLCGTPTPMQAYNLESVNFSNNNLNGSIPDDIRNLSSLQLLDLSMNLLSGSIPRWLFRMHRLNYISLSNNNFYGSIPDDVRNLYSLELLDLSRNSFSGSIPDDIRNLSSLQHLDLSINWLSGSIPRWLFRMHQLNYMSLANNNLTGELPDVLDLSMNHQLSETIPGELFCMQRLKNFISQWEHVLCGTPTPMQAYSLESVNFSNNNLNGSIPDDIRNLSSLQHLDLSMNLLSGSIPRWLFHMHRLNYISLSNNNFYGSIPDDVRNLYSLELLDLSRNSFSGSIPDDIRNLSSLQHLDLSMNLLSGSIPRWLFRMHQLNYMSLANNNLTGELPDVLDLSMNHQLSGTIPGELFCMQRLKNFISQWEHVFCGTPTPMQAYSLESVNFSNNNLNGSIPDDIRNLSSLQHLDLSINLLSGSIPGWLFCMHQLNYMSLANNNLTGELPDVLDLYNLREVNLSHNNLHGVIPKRLAFGDFFWLYSVDLSNNQLSGGILQLLNLLQLAGVVRFCFNNFSGQIPVELINEPFLEVCVDHANLCSDNKTTSLPGCSSRLCSESKLQPYLNCSIESDKNITTTTNIIAVAICSGIVGLLILGYLAQKCWKKARATIATRSNLILPSTFPFSDKDTGWEMISFHKLNFNKFDILSSLTDENLIGNGGSGKVYRAVISQTGVTVAVKSIWNDKKSDERLVKEFMAEIHTLGSIRHSNIVKLLCYISGQNMQLLVYQYFENKSLDQWLHNIKKEILPFDHSSITRLDWPMRLNIAIGVAQGLCYMHHHCSPPIIHRDIKSSNILLDSEFNAKIADFGLAKMLTTSEDTETASAVVGTFGYIAPEYAYTKRVNVKSDVYSFGAVLLELTTGRKAVMPDDHMNIAEWAQMRYKETSYIVNSLDDEIKESSFLDQIVAVFRLGVMCTIKTPANRPSMRDCLNILQDYSDSFSSCDQ